MAGGHYERANRVRTRLRHANPECRGWRGAGLIPRSESGLEARRNTGTGWKPIPHYFRDAQRRADAGGPVLGVGPGQARDGSGPGVLFVGRDSSALSRAEDEGKRVFGGGRPVAGSLMLAAPPATVVRTPCEEGRGVSWCIARGSLRRRGAGVGRGSGRRGAARAGTLLGLPLRGEDMPMPECLCWGWQRGGVAGLGVAPGPRDAVGPGRRVAFCFLRG